MSSLAAPFTRLPIRLQSLVSLTSILIQIQPVLSTSVNPQPVRVQETTQPIRNLFTSGTRSFIASSGQTPPPRGVTNSSRCQAGATGTNRNQPVRDRYMCGNSLSSMASSSPKVIQPTEAHTGTVIFLHGLGDQGFGWAETFEMIREPHIKYIFPHAGVMNVTLNMGMSMPSWFDIMSLGVGGKEDEEGIKKSSCDLLQMIAEEEAKGIPSNRIIIGGFSQGGAVALYTALTNDKSFAGILALSTWMPLFQNFKTEGVTKRALPVLQCHGTSDPLLPFSLGELTQKFLQSQVVDPEFKAFQGLAHSSSMEEMYSVRDFLKKVLP